MSALPRIPSQADLASAVAKRYWENAAAALETLLAESSDPASALRRYPETFRWALENENRMCLSGLMAAEYDDLPEAVKKEIQTFADVNVAWLSKVLSAARASTRLPRNILHRKSVCLQPHAA